MIPPSDTMKLCLISDAEPVRAAVRSTCLPPHQVDIFGLEGFLEVDHRLSPEGARIIEAARGADAVLVEWSLAQAPLINTICFAVRSTRTFAPVIALCSGGQQDMIAALAAGADDVAGFPLFLPLFQARVAAHRRLVAAVRRVTARRVKKRLAARSADAQVAHKAGILVEEIAEVLEARLEGDGASGPISEDAPAGRLAERVTSVLAEEADKFMEGLVEEVAEGLIEEIEEELLLVDPQHEVAQAGMLRLDRTAYRAYVGEEEVELTPKEFELLGFLIDHAGALCTRDQILDHVWGIDFETGTNMVDVYMHFLRKKLAAAGGGASLQTVRGRGYRLVIPDAEAAADAEADDHLNA